LDGWYVGCLVWFVLVDWLVGFVSWSVSLVRWVLFVWMGDFVGWLASCLVCLVGLFDWLVGRSVGQVVGLNTWKGVSDFDD
jgi:hypothetical protein